MSLDHHNAGAAIASTAQAIPAVPPVAVAGATLMGIPVPTLIQWITLAYVVVLLLYTLRKWVREERGASSGKSSR